jgi:hypothetical protein
MPIRGIVISAVTEVLFRRSTDKLPNGGIIVANACGNWTNISVSSGDRPTASAAWRCPSGTESSEARNNFRAISAKADPKCKHRGGGGGQRDPKHRQDEEYPEQLDDKRDTAENFAENQRAPAQPFT